MSVQPELPYGPEDDPNSGWSGSDTSAERARRNDSNGITARMQGLAVAALSEAGAQGMTWRQVQQRFAELGVMAHHGSVTGTLSVLHKTGRIARLSERRGRCKVYVLPEESLGREVEEQGRKGCCPHCGGSL